MIMTAVEKQVTLTVRFAPNLPMDGIVGRDVLVPLDVVLSMAGTTLPKASIVRPGGL